MLFLSKVFRKTVFVNSVVPAPKPDKVISIQIPRVQTELKKKLLLKEGQSVIAPIRIDNYLAPLYLIITMRNAIQSEAGIRLYTHSLCKEKYTLW